MHPLPSSYRDNTGFVFEQGGKIYRFIHTAYANDYDLLMQSGLNDELVAKGWMVPHTEIKDWEEFDLPSGKILLPEQLPFISYPYEWSFSMWQDAALLTLGVAIASLNKGMSLKDATPFNVQFFRDGPIFIDTLSFEAYHENKPWVAYRQFCECFLGPLLLMQYCHPESHKLFAVYPNGIPLNVLVSLLPKKTRWRLDVYLHIYLQARLTKKGNRKNPAVTHFSKKKLLLLLEGLTRLVTKLGVKKMCSAWENYYSDTILGGDYLEKKTTLVRSFLEDIEFERIIDLGANEGLFSLLLQDSAKNIIALDADEQCIDALYNKIKSEKIRNILPLVINLVTPSPAIGWNNSERDSITGRLKADLVMALALVHHLAIANNIPLLMIADWLKPMGKYLLVEFIPKEDEKVQLLLQNREDIFVDYTLPAFKSEFSRHYDILKEETVANTQRVLFLMKNK